MSSGAAMRVSVALYYSQFSDLQARCMAGVGWGAASSDMPDALIKANVYFHLLILMLPTLFLPL